MTKLSSSSALWGNQIGEPVENQITNMQLLEASLRSLSSVDSPELPNIHIKHVQEPHCLVLGTFLDKMLETSECLSEKIYVFGQL